MKDLNKFHAILLNVSFADSKFPEKFNIFNKVEFENSDWIVYGVEVDEDSAAAIQSNMIEGKYFNHMYNEKELIIIYKERIFKVTKDQSTWKEADEYGKSIDIPEDQLNFKPFRFEDEDEYFKN